MRLSKAQKKKRIQSIIDKWKHRLLLSEWLIEFEISEDEGGENGNGSTLAEVNVLFPYKKAYITIYKQFWSLAIDRQETSLCHELIHCHTQQLWDYCHDFANGRYHTPDDIRDAVESLTQRITLIASGDKN